MLNRSVVGMFLAGFMCSAYANDSAEALAETCHSCHGANGVSVKPDIPSIGGQPETYIKRVLLEWKNGTRHSPTMAGMVGGYSEEQIGMLAAHFARKPWVPAQQNVEASQVELGRVVSERCSGCHGESGAASDGKTPNINGQWAQYLQLELKEYRDDSEPLPNKQMRKVAKKLSEEEIKAVTAFFASQSK